MAYKDLQIRLENLLAEYWVMRQLVVEKYYRKVGYMKNKR
jgi:hypothetical protein